MDGKFHIKLQIVGRYYPLVIEREDEERFRKAARLINEKVAQYKKRYKDKDGMIKEMKLKRLDIIKIDVEGAEIYVLKEAKKSIAKFKPKIIFLTVLE